MESSALTGTTAVFYISLATTKRVKAGFIHSVTFWCSFFGLSDKNGPRFGPSTLYRYCARFKDTRKIRHIDGKDIGSVLLCVLKIEADQQASRKTGYY